MAYPACAQVFECELAQERARNVRKCARSRGATNKNAEDFAGLLHLCAICNPELKGECVVRRLAQAYVSLQS